MSLRASKASVADEPRKKPISRKEWEKKNNVSHMSAKEITKRIDELTASMTKYARDLKFEEAASVRDEINDLKQALLLMPGIED